MKHVLREFLIGVLYAILIVYSAPGLFVAAMLGPPPHSRHDWLAVSILSTMIYFVVAANYFYGP